MREYRIYQNQSLTVGAELTLDEAGSRHLGTVLRAETGTPLCLFNGDGLEYHAIVKQVSKRHVTVQILRSKAISRASPLEIHLAQTVSRGDRMDYALQKSVELGVSAITPVFSEHGEVRLRGPRLEKRLRQWEHLIISACEQCGLNQPPTLHPPQNLPEWLQQCQADYRFLLHPGKDNSNWFEQPAPRTVAAAIGPEGGFSHDEVELALAQGFSRVSLGPRILRTETAPVVCLSLLQAAWGDFRNAAN